MPRNIEIKTALSDLESTRAAVERLGARYAEDLEQVDRYYEIDGARRLKLRSFGNGRAEIIRYSRPEAEGVRASDYEVTPVRDESAGLCLVPKGRALVIVRKRRQVYMLDNVRIHLDRVEGLGEFLELEAVLDAAHDDTRCRAQVDEITAALGLDPRLFIRASYADMMRRG